jgi:prevent-host-death family protein
MDHVKKVTTREAQHGFSKLLARAEKGETIVITRRGRDVARLSRIAEDTAVWPDFAARMSRIFDDVLPGSPASALIMEDREDRR